MHYVIVSALLALHTALGVRVTTLDEQTIAGDARSWTTAGIELESTAGQQLALPVEQILRVEPLSTAPAPSKLAPSEVRFVGGGHLVAQAFTSSSSRATITGGPAQATDGEPVECSLEKVKAVRLMPLEAAVPTLEQEWQDLLRSEPAGDLIVIRKPGAANLNFVEGTLGPAGEDSIEFTLDGETIEVNRNKVFGLIYFRRPPEGNSKIAATLIGPGLRLPVAGVALDQYQLAATSPVLGKLKLSPAAVGVVDFSVDRLQYLSDLAPVRLDWTPAPGAGPIASLQEAVVRDRGFYTPHLNIEYPAAVLPPDEQSSAGLPELRTFAKGLAIRSRTELDFRVPSGFSIFRATAGIDPRASATGEVRLEIRADGQTLAQHTVRGGQVPVELECSVAQVRELTIVVDFGPGDDLGATFGSNLHLGGARFIK